MPEISKRTAIIAAGVACVGIAIFVAAPVRQSLSEGDQPTLSAASFVDEKQTPTDDSRLPSNLTRGVRQRPHSTVTDSPEIPPGDAIQAISALRPLAESGDRNAALAIYLKVNECRTAIDQATRAAPSTNPASLVPPDCAGVTGEVRREASRWLELAADSGSSYAQLLYASSLTGIVGPPSEWIKHPERVQAFKIKAMRFLHENAARGSVEAWQSLSASYAGGVLAPQNNLKAYAYYRAAQMADPSFAAPARLEQLKSLLSAQELNQAEAASRSVYAGKN
ncbi:MAG TPA: hypothetical protein VIT90_10655 [Lysobacter sp.]